MYIEPQQFRNAFDDIRKSSFSHTTCKVVIFVSCLDIDALCSARILSSLFKSELIPHKLVPIVGYQELKTSYQALDDDVVNVICIGCGATVDLESYLEILPQQDPEDDGDLTLVASDKKIYVIDNRRPWNLDNLFGSTAVICFDDGSVTGYLTKHKEAYYYLSQEEEAEEDEEEEEDDDDEHERKKSKSDSDGEKDDEDTDVDEDSPQKKKAEKKETKRMRNEHVQLIENYYARGTFLVSSSTVQVYSLLSEIGETSVPYLWLTVVGATSLDSQHPEIYSEIFPLLKDEVTRLCATNPGNVVTSEDSSLYVETDYSLFLLRHWSLYDSMIHSSYLSAKLQLWTEDGRKRLHKMLAKMGIALQESKEQWTHMHLPLKRTLKEKLTSVSGVYGIEDIIRNGVVRKYGFKGSVSAGDCVEALIALLESGKSDNYYEDAKNIIADGDKDDDEDTKKFWVSNFWAGWDALGNVNILMKGLVKAKTLQRAVVAAGSALFEKCQIKNLRTFRLAVLKDGPDLELFNNPLALARLGVWIAEGCAEVHPIPLPLVVASLDAVNETYLVLGMGAVRSKDNNTVLLGPNDSNYNKFGPAFQATASKINARVRMDAFDSSIIEVAKDDLSRFLEALTLSGLMH